MTRSSILDELSSYVPHANKEMFIEGQALQVIASARNLISLLEKSYPQELSEDLTRRLLSAIKNDNTEKFCRKVRTIRNTKQKGQ